MFSLRAPFRTIRAMPSPIAAAVAPQMAGRRFYHDKDKFPWDNAPRNPGSMDKKDPAVGTGLVGAPACGDVMKLQIRVDEATGTITDAKFKTFGCGSAIASSSYLTELVKGMRLEDASKIKNVDISKELCLPPVKLHCSMLAEDAIKAAIADYHGKNPKAKITDLAGTAKTIRETMQQAA
ncbi:iron sulfur cluster assembly protein [Pochonia chlamydosporia 170]|uniref:Iron sulfur cluster assembly protein n=1 Tax=Pochonia chlamydosporia 170 TaxID=1380566 RepID=A0A179FRY9_METCM|nr:iron sulfur cluster assembly protein [Pochonia chlamydosporia 170]OAQ67901.1 iron sulfur cluster assembly protein [Pochonia chlamydosporia 170]